MKKLTCLFALGFLLFNNTLRANEPEKVTSTEEVSETAAKKERIKQVTKDDDYEKFRFGGYGEMVAKFMNYGTNRFYGGVDNSDHRNTIAIPRFVLAFDYKFNSKWILGAEIEFEAGGVGLETEPYHRQPSYRDQNHQHSSRQQSLPDNQNAHILYQKNRRIPILSHAR